jgi:hypothetical protein
MTNLEVSSFSDTTRTLYEKQGKMIDIARSSYIVLQWSYFDNALTLENGYASPGGDSLAYGFLYDTFDELSAGAFRFYINTNFDICSNCFIRGCSEIDDCFYARLLDTLASAKQYLHSRISIQNINILHVLHYVEDIFESADRYLKRRDPM